MMKKCLLETEFDLYENGDLPNVLAEKVLHKFYGQDINLRNLPIDPFAILKSSGVVYSFQDFDKAEGFYLQPKDSKAIVGIKIDSIIARQRFTAAHELCHHLKDEVNSISLQGNNDPLEVFANNFATALLMPDFLLKQYIKTIQLTVSDSRTEYLNKVLKLSVKFGVSFQSSLIRVNDIVHKFDCKLSSICRKFKPNKKKKEQNLNNDFCLYKQAFDSLEFLKWKLDKKVKEDFLRLVVSNDNRIENGTLTFKEINELLARLRFYGLENVNLDSLNAADIEVIGQCNMYDNVFSQKKSEENIFISIIFFNKNLYKYAKNPSAGGTTRTASARITNSLVRTCDPPEITGKLWDLSNKYQKAIANKDKISKSDLLCILIDFHHELTVIHPFYDGNGRTARAVFNRQLFLLDLPPIYINYKEKGTYEKGLKEMDSNGDISTLFIYFIKIIIKTYAKLIPV